MKKNAAVIAPAAPAVEASDLDALHARLRAALLAGDDTAEIRAEISQAEAAVRDAANAVLRTQKTAEETRCAAHDRELSMRADASSASLRSLLQSLA